MGLLLSVLITSHNQGVLLERCVNSVLAQNLPFEYEIIISDDWSTDGTWEIAKSLAKKNTIVKAIQCNTDDFNPVNRCQRCGWNQCNAYRNSTGKYFAHIDSDDFFMEGTDVLRKQVELLEQHLECSCCMANNYRLNEGEDLACAMLDNPHPFVTGFVLSSEDYIANYWRVDHAFVYRRYTHEDPTKLFGGYYDDTLITDYHVQFGDIVCLNDAGYVYVQYKNSIWNEVMSTKDNIVMNPAMFIPSLLPQWGGLFCQSCNLRHLLLVAAELIRSGHRLQEGNLAYLKGLSRQNKLVGMLNRDLSLTERIYLVLRILDLKALKHVSWRPLYWLPSKVWKE